MATQTGNEDPSRPSPAAHGPWPPPAGWSTQDGSPSPRPAPVAPRARVGGDWRIGLMSAAVAVLVVAGALVYALGPSPSASPRARLESALTSTRTATDADLAIDIKATFGGFTLSVRATGAVDFVSKSMSLQMDLAGQTLASVEGGGVVYEKLGKLVSSQFPGKTWVRVPVSAVANQGGDEPFVTAQPQQLFTALVNLGATVTPVGTSTIAGTSDQGYRIHLTLADLEAHASELPAYLRSLFATAKAKAAAPATAAVSATMYIDPAGQLQAADVVFMARATGHPVTASVDLTMSNFGSATVAPPPPATQTVTYEQLKGVLGSGSLLGPSGGAQVG
jgi:hypothetical protein